MYKRGFIFWGSSRKNLYGRNLKISHINIEVFIFDIAKMQAFLVPVREEIITWRRKKQRGTYG